MLKDKVHQPFEPDKEPVTKNATPAPPKVAAVNEGEIGGGDSKSDSGMGKR